MPSYEDFLEILGASKSWRPKGLYRPCRDSFIFPKRYSKLTNALYLQGHIITCVVVRNWLVWCIPTLKWNKFRCNINIIISSYWKTVNLIGVFLTNIVSWRGSMEVLNTYSTVQSRSREANWFAAIQEIPRISRKPKVHYRTHKRPPPVSILGQPNPVHIPTPHLLEIRPNIIHQSTPRSPQWSPSLRFPHQDPIHLPLLTYTRHMPSPCRH